MLPDFFAMSNRDKNNRPNSGSRQPYGRNLFRALGSQVVKGFIQIWPWPQLWKMKIEIWKKKTTSNKFQLKLLKKFWIEKVNCGVQTREMNNYLHVKWDRPNREKLYQDRSGLWEESGNGSSLGNRTSCGCHKLYKISPWKRNNLVASQLRGTRHSC